VNCAKACFNVENYRSYISTQADAAIRQVARQYPYDINSDGEEKSLRGSSIEIAEQLKNELQKTVEISGIEIIEARISNLSYAQEIAAVMLQRQQASAVVEAKTKIVEGAVGMVKLALEKLNSDGICKLDDDKKAQIVSNLLVVLCSNKDATPVIQNKDI
jgi:membrane protease subunit (stomatin/prohibitin family)